jgi:heme exporter protein D
MSWQGWDQFVAMGGYGLYVWGSYLVTLGLIAAEVVLVAKRRRNVMRQLRSFARAESRRT